MSKPPRLPALPGRTRRTSSLFARGETPIWLTGGALTICILMIVGLLALVGIEGFATFWPKPIERLDMVDGAAFMGEEWEEEEKPASDEEVAALVASLPAEAGEKVAAAFKAGGNLARRTKLRTGNYELLKEHFTWIPSYGVQKASRPEWALAIERLSWGRFYGELVGYMDGEQKVAETPEAAWLKFEAEFDAVAERRDAIREIEKDDIGSVNHKVEKARFAMIESQLDHGVDSAAYREAVRKREELAKWGEGEQKQYEERIAKLRTENARPGLLMRVADGREVRIPLDTVVRAYPANRLGFTDKLGVYGSRWWEFLAGEPREANAEGGVWPAIFGTVVMTLLMTLLVVPFGVLAALYLREYARQGFLISLVRIAVGNLAGVPSIVFGVFGLGFFCYIVGGSIDSLFFEERLPQPTYGTGGLLWASLTLALLTLPVVIVATEEALAAVPNSMREGSYACGASKWQTIRRIVLPRAAPGIMTGMILAIARGAGEVAPLMLVGAVKLAPELPVDGVWPFVHPERSFMHLGFHIYDVGLQSSNSEASRPMVFSTTLLLIGIVVVLNLVAIGIRTRLRRAQET